MSLRKEDIQDLDIADAIELLSDGYYIYLNTTVVSTTSGSNEIVINMPSDNEGILYSADHPVESGDRIYLVGTSGGVADGYFIVDTVINNLTFTVFDTIASSTGGTIYFMYPAGATKIGFDGSLIGPNINTVQDAIKYVADNSSGISATAHKTLRDLIHFIDEGPGGGFASGATKQILPAADPFPTNIIWRTADSNKLVEKIITRNPNKTPSQIIWNMYAADGTTIVNSVVDTISYFGIFEISRTRSIT